MNTEWTVVEAWCCAGVSTHIRVSKNVTGITNWSKIFVIKEMLSEQVD